MTKHIERDKRTGRLSYRRVFPAELRPFVPSREVKRSLKAKTLSDPEAQRRFSEAEAEYERLERSARIKVEGKLPALAEADIPFLAKTHAHRLQASLVDTHFDENDARRGWLAASAWRYAPLGFMDTAGAALAGREGPWSNAERLREALPGLREHWRRLVADGDRRGVIEAEGNTVENLLCEYGLTFDTRSDEFFQLCRALLAQDMASATKLALLLDEGADVEVEAQPERNEVAVARSTPQRPTASLSMDALAEDLLAQKVNPVSRSTRQIWQTGLRLWREVHGDIGWKEITRADVTRWLDLVAERPAKLDRRQSSMPLPKLVELYSGRKDVRRLTGKTLQQHLGVLSSIWGKARRRGLIERDDNPFRDYAINVEKRSGGNALSRDELRAMFALPVFTQHERPSRGRGEAAYWIPLLALCTGARPGEIAQLVCEDFWQDSRGQWMMRYTDEGDHPVMGPRRLKTSEHGSGQRTFPIPQALLDLGFPDYLRWLEDQAELALFPKLTQTTKGLYDGWARWWGEYIRAHGVIGEGKRQLRELRHNFPTVARSSGVSFEALAYLMGHKTIGTTGRYGDLSPLGAEIAKISNFGVDLASVRRWKAPCSS
ncbi:DUF6538 domain-containing protein [Aurantiacibacter hainanensis]|uniref:DUF6538 domain-containing protein n=1 Tax=Aurantiacibacter hainanensis TaxID=3076114 RepID=UPI003EB9A40C